MELQTHYRLQGLVSISLCTEGYDAINPSVDVKINCP